MSADSESSDSDAFPIIMIISGYTLSRKSSMENLERIKCVTTSLCEKLICLSLNEIMHNLIVLVFILDVIVVFLFSTHTVFTGLSSSVPGYDSSLMMISAYICTVQRCLPVLHRVTVAFLTPLLCVCNVGDTFSDKCMQPLMCSSSRLFL